ncbi:MAG TPA: DUF711 family protein [Candidatus Limnocylindrales bacterium]|nr:DUF711 family protein [Candidatus Limnocylindrales bacterium]
MRALRNNSAIVALCLSLALSFAALSRASDEASAPKPKIRAVTAFVRLERPRYQEQIAETLRFLRQAKSAFEKKGYEVETIRITTQPFTEYSKGLSTDEALAFFRDYDALAVKEGFDASIGPAMTADSDDPTEAELLGKVIANSKILEGSVVIGGEDGIHWKSIRAAAGVIQFLEANTPRSQGNFNFTASSFVPSGTPFYPASYFAGQGRQFALAFESAHVVAGALASAKSPEDAENSLRKSLGFHAQQIEHIAQALSKETQWAYGGIDLSPAPLKDISIGAAIEGYLHAPLGSSGTLSAAALITRSIRAIPVKQAGYSGLMLPVLEDSTIAQRWSEGRLSMDAILAYSAVCGTGLDTIPLPGDVSRDQLERILSDVASLSVKWHKPLAARLMPIAGKAAGEMTEFNDPFLVNAKIRPLP